MSESCSGYQIEKILDALGSANHKLHVLGHKLQSFGILLERQGAESEGFTELEGLGFALRDLGEEVHELGKDLDTGNFRYPKPRRVE